MAPLILPVAELDLSTRRKTRIVNRLDRNPSAEGFKQAISDYKKEFKNAIHRDVGPCATFNCHGLTFGARRTWIEGSQQIQKILDEDDYVTIPAKETLPGDIAIYTKDGQIEHSGIVVEGGGSLKQPKILSKWANLHEVVHLPLECPYPDMSIAYHRIKM
jgi:hypothetical protein